MNIFIEIGEVITDLGLFLTPLSFISYIFLNIVLYMWDKINYAKAVKVFWYIAAGIGEATGDERYYLLLVLIIFMDACDSFFEFLKEKRDNPDKTFKKTT